MSNIKHYVTSIKNGEVYFDEQFKFALILHEVGILHLIFAILFLISSHRILCIYNVCIFIGYLSLDYLNKLKKLKITLFIAAMEVIIHTFLTTIFIGINKGFFFYCFTMVPAAFYVILSWNSFKKKELSSILYTIVFILSISANFMISYFIEPIEKMVLGWQIAFMIFNIVMSILAMAQFLILLDWDIMHKAERMQILNNELDEEANIDPLTRLYNRRFMDKKLEDKLADLSKEGAIFGIIMADIDDFKKINDTYGHDFGDEVLKAAAQALLKSTRDDDFVCRWGGEEFLIAINGNKKITADVAERMRQAVNSVSVKALNEDVKITMTFGISESIPGLSIEKLISIADENLYKGKKNGKNQVVSD